MTLARKDPLAAGVYWLDVWRPSMFLPKYPDGEPHMQLWLGANADRVKLIKRELTSDWSTKDNPRPTRLFYTFQVLAAPGPFPFAKLGFPTIVKLAPPDQITEADRAVKSDDTVHKPPPEPLFDPLAGFGLVWDEIKPWAIVAGLLYLWSRDK